MILIAIITFLFFTSIDMALYPIPMYILELGGGPKDVGFVAGTFGFAAILLRPFLGRICDTRGEKGILLAGMLAAATAPLLLMLVTDLRLVLLVRAYHGLSLAAVVLATQSMMAGLAPEGKKGQALALQGMADGAGLLLGPPLGQWIYERIGIGPLFISIAILAAAGLFLAFFVNKPKHGCEETVIKNSEGTGTFLQPQLVLATLLGFAVAFTFGSVMTFLPVYANELEFKAPGLLFAIVAACAIMGRYVTGKVSVKFGCSKMVLPALLLLTGGVLLLAFPWANKLLYLATALIGLGLGAGHCGLLTMAAEVSAERVRGRSISFFITIFDLGISISGYILGFVVEYSGYPIAFLAAAAFGLLLGLPTYARLLLE